jgi:hypothetical protein
MQKIPYVDKDDRRNRLNAKFEKSQPDGKIKWASPKKFYHEKQIEKVN